ncbi:hypothetical protein DFQ28_002876 [Apophysomyces sp. BC1034]|nr:hypothetical protein DFQ30_005493 [Apophysomyces sp. BC1015]KAG0179139.1 hypothetical protein DFQ29_002475 [Apophysomyces sp. BC1021]KAG0189801.1 hypothetical protein DFQ28_002876 [Apophysomyces sp. BC1034]
MVSSKRRVVAIVGGLGVVLILLFLSRPSFESLSNSSHVVAVTTSQRSKTSESTTPSTTAPFVPETMMASPIPVEFPDPFALHQPTAGEKYVTYLPHSGFHNQRIELENAFLLAAYLNRTLLLPSVFLGNPAMPWLRYNKMYERLLLQTKRGLEHCPGIPDDMPFPSECLNYFRWTSVPWTFFYDFSAIRQRVRIIFRDDLSYEWLYDNLNITAKQVHVMRDLSPYEFRVYDDPQSQTKLAKFVNRIELVTLEAITEPVLHFGSVFGTYRVLAQTEEHAQLLKFLRTHMILRNPVLVDTAKRVVTKLGGVSGFVGLHVRVGDGLFKVRASIHVDDIYHQLVNTFTDLNLDHLNNTYDPNHDQDRLENSDYEVRQLRQFQPIEEPFRPLAVEHPPDIDKRLGEANNLDPALTCQTGDAVTRRFQKTVVYIATDAPDPRNNPLLKKIFATFPCVFVLGDFKDELEDMKRIEVVEEKIKLESYLIPMVDAIIAAQGHTFYGTKDSTFSSYIERQLHPVYTNKEVKVMRPRKKSTA